MAQISQLTTPNTPDWDSFYKTPLTVNCQKTLENCGGIKLSLSSSSTTALFKIQEHFSILTIQVLFLMDDIRLPKQWHFIIYTVVYLKHVPYIETKCRTCYKSCPNPLFCFTHWVLFYTLSIVWAPYNSLGPENNEGNCWSPSQCIMYVIL